MKMKYVFTLVATLGLLCALLLPAPAAVVAADNLAANGDLELGNTGGWDVEDAVIDTTTAHGGKYSLKLNATSAYVGAAFKTIPVRSNATVTVSFYYRYAADPGNKLYHVYTYQGPNVYKGPYGGGADASFRAPSGANGVSTWRQISYTFNSGDNTAITLKFCPGGIGSSPCYIDDLVVTAQGGDEVEMEPYLTSFGTKQNRPAGSSANVIKQGGFEATTGAAWNTQSFISGGLQTVEDPTAPEGKRSLYLNAEASATWHTFPVSVEKYTQYTFSAWVKSPRLSEDNRATATFGVANAETGDFLVYQPYNGNGYGSASLSTKKMQLMTTAPDDGWHLRSVTFHSGSHDTVLIAVYGGQSQLYLDDIALYKSAYGVEYISPLRTDTVAVSLNTGNKYCADEDSLIEGVYMTTEDEQKAWSKNPAWRNGFLSFAATGDSHGTALCYTASARSALQLWYVDWIDVQPHTSYTLTLDVKRLATGDGRIVLLDDDYDSPKEFYSIALTATDGDWMTYSVTFDTQSYSRIGFAIVDGGGGALIDEVRLFDTRKGVANKPTEGQPTLKPVCTSTSVMEMSGATQAVLNSDFENSVHSWDIYQGTTVTADAAHDGGYGAHLKGDGSWGALIEQTNIPVTDGETYTLSYWYKANSNGSNATITGKTTGTQYGYEWIANSAWTYVTQTFTVEGDTSLVLNFCGGGDGVAEDIYLDNVRLISADSNALLGVAFLMEMKGYHITMDEQFRFDAPLAAVDPYENGTTYRLRRMGAVMTNDAYVGTDVFRMTLAGVNGTTVTDVAAVYLWSASDTGCQFAVRVANVPVAHRATPIYARPYYVFEKDGKEIVVYGDIISRSYDG